MDGEEKEGPHYLCFSVEFRLFFKEHLINTELKQFFLYFSEMSVCKWRGRKSPLEFEQTSQLVDERCKFVDVGALH